MEKPTLTHVICNAVMVCSCPAKIVLVLNVMGGEIQCPSCKERWKSTGARYTITETMLPMGGVQKEIGIEVDIVSASISDLILDPDQMKRVLGGKFGS